MNKKDAKSLIVKVRPSLFMDYKDFLRTAFLFLKKEKAGYTYMMYAEDLGFSATNIISHFIQGRRPVTQKSAKIIAESLHLAGIEKKYFLRLIDYANAKDPQTQEAVFDDLYKLRSKTLEDSEESKNMKYFSNWAYPIIGEFAKLDSFKSDPEWISNNLMAPISPKEISLILEYLADVGILNYDKKTQTYQRSKMSLSTNKEAGGIDVLAYHLQMLEQSSRTLRQTKAKDRDFSAMTLTLSIDEIEKLKQLFHKFQDEIMRLENNTNKANVVYQINIQAFPFTKLPDDKGA
jgi:uncharacterized protein (TIGR02147 family)